MDIYVDTNVFVFARNKKDKKYKPSKKLFSYIKRKKINILTSVFTILEVACTISQKEGKDKALQYILNIEHEKEKNRILFFEPEKEKIKSLFDLITKIITQSIQYKAHTGDAIHIHTILTNKLKVDYFITYNIKHFINFCKSENIQLLKPEDFLKKEPSLSKKKEAQLLREYLPEDRAVRIEEITRRLEPAWKKTLRKLEEG